MLFAFELVVDINIMSKTSILIQYILVQVFLAHLGAADEGISIYGFRISPDTLKNLNLSLNLGYIIEIDLLVR